MELAPVILFVYNRPEHTRICLEHLEQNKLAAESELYIFADGAKPGGEEAVAAVRRVVSRPWKFRRVTVVERPENRGLAANVIDGVSCLYPAKSVGDILQTAQYGMKHGHQVPVPGGRQMLPHARICGGYILLGSKRLSIHQIPEGIARSQRQ